MDNPNELYNDTVIWLAVIERAIEDACNVTLNSKGEPKKLLKNGAKYIEVFQARTWFRDQGPDYKEVCINAEIDPDFIYNIVMPKIRDAEEQEARIKASCNQSQCA